MTSIVLTLSVLCIIGCGVVGIACGECIREGETAKCWYCTVLVLSIAIAIPYGCFYLGRASQ